MKKSLSLIMLSLLATGCTQTYVAKLAPQSHFDYPNSNVYPLGYVQGQASKTSFFVPPDKSSSLEYEAITKAIEQSPSADMLINTLHFMDITQVLVLPIYTVTYRVEGTAARMKAGTQVLK
ncbi:hypothetical protein [Methylobacter marinus]|uniref:hypothetical protein n=1 Tax=Methylobacter marinus TaxID=34058 RepID=UPI00039ACA91|nr:hypothetical protein [Methylobacter marinus]